MLSGKKLLNYIWEIANPSEKETLKKNEKQWETIIVQGEAAEELLKNESFKKGLEFAQIRFIKLVDELLKHNDRETDLRIKAEANNIINTFNGFYGSKKKAKETLEADLRKKFGLEE